MQERLQKILSARGIASRRKAEEYIRAGLVTVNGEVATIGQQADPEKDTIVVDGRVTEDRAQMQYILLHKPRGVVTSNVERWNADTPRIRTEGAARSARARGGKPPQSLAATTVRDLLPPSLQGVVYPVGRLDKESSGLLLLTNDGPLAYRLTHPRFEHEKEYVVTVDRRIDDESLMRMAEGMMILGSMTKPATVQRLGTDRFSIALTEGKNRQIRRMCERCDFRVRALRRVRILGLQDDALAPGEMRPLTEVERDGLLRATGLAS